MTDLNFVFDIFNKNRQSAIKSFIEFIKKQNEDTCMDIVEKKRITDNDARIIIKNQCKIDNAIDLQKLDIPRRNIYLKELKEKHNLSIRQIERLTGINRGIIAKQL